MSKFVTKEQLLKGKIERIEKCVIAFRDALLGLSELSLETNQVKTSADEFEVDDNGFEMV